MIPKCRFVVLVAVGLLIAAWLPGENLPERQEGTVLIATFNIRYFSDGSRDPDELRDICRILQAFDLIALQETRDTRILDRAEAMLFQEHGVNYDYVASDPVGRGQKELYAFLYRRDRVQFLCSSGIFADPDDLLAREPYYARFRAGEFDFYIITIHSTWSGGVTARRAEAMLLDDLFTHLQALSDEDDILLMGDFNLGPDDEGFAELRAIAGMVAVNPDIPTSIKDRLYDNIWFDSDDTSEYTGEWGVFRYDEEWYENDDKAASLAVSDHRPLWARFDVSADDDS